ncbi:MAG: hypothetical protein JNK73_08715 [Bacteroidia bacterium]|nr:hypothetical protein [Bacteroidia bacterium]
MKLSSQVKTILSGLTFSLLGCLISFWTGWIIIIPILYGLSIPIVNVDGQFVQKFKLTLVSAISSAIILIATTVFIVGFDLGKYIFPGILVGIAAVFILVINGFLLEVINLNLKTIALVFTVSALTLPLSIYYGGRIFGSSLSDLYTRLNGIIFVWLSMTTIAISFGMRKNPTAKKRLD